MDAERDPQPGGKSFGIVLGAGGTAGEAFHRGVIRAMGDLGYDARQAAIIVGTSAGSIVAASLRHRPAIDTAGPLPQARRLRRFGRNSALDVVRRPRQALTALLLAPEFAQGRISTDFISEGLRRRYGMSWPEAALWIVAVRRGDGQRVVFGKPGEATTDVASAVAASCAVPGYFQAVDIAGTSYVDGGVHSPTNADLLAGHQLDVVVCSSPMSVAAGTRMVRVDLPPRLLFRRYLRDEVWTLTRRGTRVISLEPDRPVLESMGLNMMSGRQSDVIEQRAYELAQRRLVREHFTSLVGVDAQREGH